MAFLWEDYGLYLQNLKIPVVFSGLVGLCPWWCFTDFEKPWDENHYFLKPSTIWWEYFLVFFFSNPPKKLANLSQIEDRTLAKWLPLWYLTYGGWIESETFRVSPTMCPTMCCSRLHRRPQHDESIGVARALLHRSLGVALWHIVVDGNQKSGDVTSWGW